MTHFYENWYVTNPLVLLSLQILVKSTKINFVEKSNKSEIMQMLHAQLCYYWDSKFDLHESSAEEN